METIKLSNKCECEYNKVNFANYKDKKKCRKQKKKLKALISRIIISKLGYNGMGNVAYKKGKQKA